jgi:hypothetical protein
MHPRKPTTPLTVTLATTRPHNGATILYTGQGLRSPGATRQRTHDLKVRSAPKRSCYRPDLEVTRLMTIAELIPLIPLRRLMQTVERGFIEVDTVIPNY